ncbi:MAG: PilZ domain-containing protein [Pseudomonadota bacterium]
MALVKAAKSKAAPATPPGSRYLQKPEDVKACLRDLRDRRCVITLRFENNPTSFQCKVLDVHEKHFYIEDISPRDGLVLLKNGEKFSISARGDGMFAFVTETRVSKVDEERGLPFFHIPLPESLLLQQRRRAERYQLPLRIRSRGADVSIFRTLQEMHELNLVGEIIDISAGGCRAEFDQPITPSLQVGEKLTTCTVTVADMLEIHSEAVIRHVAPIKSSNRIVCGIEFTSMQMGERRRLKRFIEILSKNNPAV